MTGPGQCAVEPTLPLLATTLPLHGWPDERTNQCSQQDDGAANRQDRASGLLRVQLLPASPQAGPPIPTSSSPAAKPLRRIARFMHHGALSPCRIPPRFVRVLSWRGASRRKGQALG